MTPEQALSEDFLSDAFEPLEKEMEKFDSSAGILEEGLGKFPTFEVLRGLIFEPSSLKVSYSRVDSFLRDYGYSLNPSSFLPRGK